MLQAQKLIKLEVITGAKAQAQEEPEGEILVGAGGEAVRPPGMNTISFPISFLLCFFFLVYLGSSPSHGSLFTFGAL